MFEEAVSGLREYYPEVLTNTDLVHEISIRVTIPEDDGSLSQQARYESVTNQVERLCTEYIMDNRFITKPKN